MLHFFAKKKNIKRNKKKSPEKLSSHFMLETIHNKNQTCYLEGKHRKFNFCSKIVDLKFLPMQVMLAND